ncbi:hypothetical protein [Streptomyces hainanensis]|uniref:Uncharacterized protein n=1 Tax=Streptomyces hainanensis TaxID=402648 RepID=A0A4R4SUW3_9ACTN|nr:hypothetical protein [Streptomyces hainanensis]TDC67960.1 hypothetical protein E1283_28060 [Streptomyces hainanensis]
MSFHQEWAAIQARAQDASARTRLNGTGGRGGGDEADLELHSAELTDIRNTAEALAGDLDTAGHTAENPTRVAGILLRTPGFETGNALIEVATRWQSQADALRDACLRVSGHLEDTVRTHTAVEQETAAALRDSTTALNPRLTGAV